MFQKLVLLVVLAVIPAKAEVTSLAKNSTTNATLTSMADTEEKLVVNSTGIALAGRNIENYGIDDYDSELDLDNELKFGGNNSRRESKIQESSRKTQADSSKEPKLRNTDRIKLRKKKKQSFQPSVITTDQPMDMSSSTPAQLPHLMKEEDDVYEKDDKNEKKQEIISIEPNGTIVEEIRETSEEDRISQDRDIKQDDVEGQELGMAHSLTPTDDTFLTSEEQTESTIKRSSTKTVTSLGPGDEDSTMFAPRKSKKKPSKQKIESKKLNWNKTIPNDEDSAPHKGKQKPSKLKNKSKKLKGSQKLLNEENSPAPISRKNKKKLKIESKTNFVTKTLNDEDSATSVPRHNKKKPSEQQLESEDSNWSQEIQDDDDLTTFVPRKSKKKPSKQKTGYKNTNSRRKGKTQITETRNTNSKGEEIRNTFAVIEKMGSHGPEKEQIKVLGRNLIRNKELERIVLSVN